MKCSAAADSGGGTLDLASGIYRLDGWKAQFQFVAQLASKGDAEIELATATRAGGSVDGEEGMTDIHQCNCGGRDCSDGRSEDSGGNGGERATAKASCLIDTFARQKSLAASQRMNPSSLRVHSRSSIKG